MTEDVDVAVGGGGIVGSAVARLLANGGARVLVLDAGSPASAVPGTHLRNVPAHLEAQAIPSAVDLMLRGSREALARVEADDIVAYIDLAGLGPGQYSLTVHADSSPEAGVTHIEPSSVQVRISSGK